jgi:hypothetical protein
VRSRAGKHPRDFDLWPHSSDDRRLLLAWLDARPHCTRVQETRWNVQFAVESQPCGPTYAVEVVTYSEVDLPSQLARFDLALSCAGVEFRAGRPPQAKIHPDFFSSRLSVTSVEFFLIFVS